MVKCIICGCTQNSACIHPHAGPCAWASSDPAICDQCLNPEIFNHTIRPAINLKRVKKLSPRKLQSAFKVAGFLVNIKKDKVVKGEFYYYRLTLIEGFEPDYKKLLYAWYPNAERGPFPSDSYDIDLNESALLLYARNPIQLMESEVTNAM